ncbi:MAG: efflux RND transporter periplasmic adaptor subunit [Patescibacteria group bacterium]|nr:efflux RND transporter periplasmic adaptor subunit [Patescibacteria group bacterium]
MNIRVKIKKHKVLSSFALIIILLIGYYFYGKINNSSVQVSYVLGSVERGVITTSVSASGQVSTLKQVDIKPKASGDIVSVPVINGQEVKAGTLIAVIDTRDAEIALESARIALAKLTQPADAVSLIQAQNALEDAIQSNQKSIDDGFSAVSNAFLDMPDVVIGLSDIFYKNGSYLNEQNVLYLGDTTREYRNKAIISLGVARNKYDATLIQYKTLSRTSATSSIESLIVNTYDTVKSLSDAIKDAKNTIDYVISQKSDRGQSLAVSAIADVNNWTGKINNNLVNLLSIKNNIINFASSLREKQQSLIKLESGPDALDIQSQQLSLKQKEYAYQDYFVRAPFDGIIAKLNLKKGDSASSGTAIATLITSQKIANISLNELDVAKIKLGNKSILSFDAVQDLSITGEVTEIDTIGTVTQGVVTYSVQITFDTQDERIKSGMSVSASIISDSRQDVLKVPNSAIKTSRGISSVQMLINNVPSNIPVTVGISNDTESEIISGINEGDSIIIRTVNSSSQTTAVSATRTPSLFNIGGGTTRRAQ